MRRRWLSYVHICHPLFLYSLLRSFFILLSRFVSLSGLLFFFRYFIVPFYLFWADGGGGRESGLFPG